MRSVYEMEPPAILPDVVENVQHSDSTHMVENVQNPSQTPSPATQSPAMLDPFQPVTMISITDAFDISQCGLNLLSTVDLFLVLPQ